MITKFNDFDHMEMPLLITTNPEEIPYGVIDSDYIKDFSYNLKFSDVSEITFTVYKFEGEAYEKLYPMMRVNVENMGSWIVDSADETKSNEGDLIYKSVTLKSTESELQYIEIPYIDGTYLFYNPTNENSLMKLLLNKMPKWKLGYVDSNIASLSRTFEVPEVNMLEFLLNDVSESYGCVFTFNWNERIISCYDINTYVNYTNVILTQDELINQTQIARSSDSIVTALSVTGDDDLSINAVNPIGTSTIYDFTIVKPWMSEELRAKVELWEAKVKSYEEPVAALNVEIGNLYNEQSAIKVNLDGETTRLNGLNKERDAMIVKKADLSEINATIATCQSNINTYQAQYNAKNSEITAKKSELTAKQQEVNPATYFGALYDNFLSYVYEFSYDQSNIGITDSMTYSEKIAEIQALYNDARDNLDQKVAVPDTYTVDTKSFIFNKKFKEHTDTIQPGYLVGVEVGEPNDGNVQYLPITEINVNFDDKSCSFSFGNLFNAQRAQDLFAELMHNVSATGKTVEYINGKKANAADVSDMQKFINNALDLSKNAILSADGQTVEITDSGYHGRRIDPQTKLLDTEEVALINNTLAFTRDNWNTCSLALGKIQVGEEFLYGLAAEAVIGKFIIGENLYIGNNSGTYTIDDNGFVASNSTNTVKITPNNDDELMAIYKGDATVESNRQFYIDSKGNVHFKGDITGSNGSFSGSLNAATGTFSGELSAASGTFSGKVSGGEININDKFIVGSSGIVEVKSRLHLAGDGYIASENGNIQLYASSGKAYFGGECECLNIKVTGGSIGGLIVNTDNISASEGKIQFKSNGDIYCSGTLQCTNLQATGGSITGISIGGFTINSDNISSSNGALQLHSNGNCYLTSGTVGGFSLSNNYIASSNGLVQLKTDGTGKIGLWNFNTTSIYNSSGTKFATDILIRNNKSAYWASICDAANAYASDKRIKKNIDYDISQYEEVFDNLKPCSWNYMDGCGIPSQFIHMGFIAQDNMHLSNKYNLALVGTDNPERYTLDRQELIALCVYKIKKLESEVKELKEKLQEKE